MPITTQSINEADVIRDSAGRVIAYREWCREQYVWVPVPPAYLVESVTFPPLWLTEIEPLLKESK